MNPDYINAPITDGYARDMVLEAQRLLLPTFPSGKDLVFVEFFEIPGVALDAQDSVIFYHPDMIHMINMDQLCQLLTEVFTSYVLAMQGIDPEDMIVPEGTTIH